MTTLKVLFTLFLSFILITGFSQAKPISANKTAELNSQIKDEVRQILKTPYLKFLDKNLNGEVTVSASVTKNGKINFKEIKGINENLTSNVIDRLNSLNLWASPDYSGKTFVYKINYKN